MIPRIVAVASLSLLMGTACGPAEPESAPAPSTAEAPQEESPPSHSSGEEFHDGFARKAPEYAGLWLESGKPVVATVDVSDEAKARLRAAIESWLVERGLPPDAELEFRLVAYSWNQLHAWKRVMGDGASQIPTFRSLDANEARNRVVVGLKDLSYEPVARQYAESHGVPREALVVEYSDFCLLLLCGKR
jgi:hypothetical protein